jgi:hypothetical protein
MKVIWSECGMKESVPYAHSQEFVKDDGGRSEYFKGDAGDCVTRAIAIATGIDYKEVYDAMFNGIEEFKQTGHSRYVKKLRRKKSGSRGTTPRNGVHRKIYDKYLKSLGWKWVATMTIGSGCKTHLRADELPKGRLIVRVSKHIVAVIDGVIHDTYDCSRGGKRCVYGYYVQENPTPIVKKKTTITATKTKNVKSAKQLSNLTDWHKVELTRLVDIRLDTIEDDPESADEFETVNTLGFLRDKIEYSLDPRFTKEEKKWLIEELSNTESIGVVTVDKLLDYINRH